MSNGVGSELIPMVGSVFIMSLIIWAIIAWRKMKHKANLQHKLMDKFSTGPELNEFLQSSGGGKFLDFLTVGGLAPKEKLLEAISKGVIFTIVGIALLLIGPFLQGAVEEVRGIQAFGIIAIALGIGFLVSTFISYRLSKKWGIIEDTK